MYEFERNLWMKLMIYYCIVWLAKPQCLRKNKSVSMEGKNKSGTRGLDTIIQVSKFQSLLTKSA